VILVMGVAVEEILQLKSSGPPIPAIVVCLSHLQLRTSIDRMGALIPLADPIPCMDEDSPVAQASVRSIRRRG